MRFNKPEKLIEAEKLTVEISVKLKDFELEPVRLKLNSGDYLALLGPTGSGKSVFLEAIAGFYPCSGRIILDGRDISKIPPEKRRIGVVYQDYVLFPRMSVYENIAYGLDAGIETGCKRLRITRRKEQNNGKGFKTRKSYKEEVEEVAKLMHIDHLLERKPSTLSGGEKQRVAIARALVAKPKLLLMDEPFSALDAKTKNELRELVKKAVKKLGITVIHATHDLDDVSSLANKVCVLVRSKKSSRVAQQGYIDEVFTYPVKEVAELCGINYLVGYAKKTGGELVEVKVGSLKLLGKAKEQFDGLAAVCIKPELFNIYHPKNVSGETYKQDERSANIIRCEVLEVHRYFHLVWMKVKAGRVVLRCCFTPSNSFCPLLHLHPHSSFHPNLLLEIKPENVCVYSLGGDKSECNETL